MTLPVHVPDLPVHAGERNDLALQFARIAVEAGAVVMRIYEAGATARFKADASPVCEADELAEALILTALRRVAPGIPVLAEEAAARGDRPLLDGRFILVDPVDGTKEFLNRNGEFTVNIALIEHGVARAGAVYAPALGRLWFAGEDAHTCQVAPGAALEQAEGWHQLHSRAALPAGLVVMASRSHADAATEDYLAALPVAERRSAGSSLKFCAIAAGEADLYPRFGPTMEWDTAAGDAVLRAAGGIVLSLDGAALRYGKKHDDFRNGGFLAWGRESDARRFASEAPGRTPAS
ncbi:3'(2'),5'-bisphosphate nucleotidase CysQ [Lichenihabitans sp. Uapishka_5]|uniref:3'(2'),5'-bisphosphate nucleotidase CysQ n=1 Tax=Lichenihabitans sp. Uapishka_5 TaxID=3037302 RepID=UPI0029E80B64|nr:3'(2'),5'-bisphosphate nucleotidase CysQ [Lichenihabitans sp. Uapishka_5]MDX7950636.1 3'(2'),5'-bisphosphate nucleotidase CysQ [Lichenihabitans sp. Uapishka_5]